MIFRIFDACGGKLTSVDWMICQKYIILEIISNNEKYFQAQCTTNLNAGSSDISRWNQTAIATLDAFAGLVDRYLASMILHESFDGLWRDFGGFMRGFLNRRALNLSTTVFSALSRILSEVGECKGKFSKCTETIWDIWKDGNPAGHQDESPTHSDNQSALRAYLQCLQEIYHLTADSIELTKIRMIIEQLQVCITASTPMSYASDIDTLTPLQTQVLSTIEMIQTNSDGVPSELIKGISSLMILAYNRDTEDSNHKGPTYIAFSKVAMDVLRLYVVRHIEDREIHSSGALTKALHSLTVPIRLKYKWHLEGKEPAPWQQATTAIVSILRAAIPLILERRMTDIDSSSFWREVLEACRFIIFADLAYCDDRPKILKDQEFDMAAFHNIRNLITQALGSDQVSNQLRRKYTESLFEHSIIHEPHPQDLPQPEQDLLTCLQSMHIGRVQDLPRSLRSKMSYVLLDELFNLVAVYDSSPARIRLAQAAAPYLILRVAIVLKAYIFDQPLRGRMPQPISQKREMLYILRRLVELDSEPKAIPDTPNVTSKHKKHLHRLYSLVTKALRVARRDEEMQNALTEVVEMVGQGFMD